MVELLSSFAVKTEDGTFCLALRCLSCLIVAMLVNPATKKREKPHLNAPRHDQTFPSYYHDPQERRDPYRPVRHLPQRSARERP